MLQDHSTCRRTTSVRVSLRAGSQYIIRNFKCHPQKEKSNIQWLQNANLPNHELDLAHLSTWRHGHKKGSISGASPGEKAVIRRKGKTPKSPVAPHTRSTGAKERLTLASFLPAGQDFILRCDCVSGAVGKSLF